MARLDQLRRLAESAPHDPLTHYGVGLELLALERWQDAITAFEQALRCDGQYVAAYQQKARAELKLGRRDAAAATLRRGIELATRRGDLHAADDMRKLLEPLA